nr:MAG TPA: hypothetical protein [Caudoviricetes sp.]
MVSKNSPGDIFEKWFRFHATFEQAHRVASGGENSFSSIRGLLSSLVRGALPPLLRYFLHLQPACSCGLLQMSHETIP